jgi:thiamine biosynthesis lipoprotein
MGGREHRFAHEAMATQFVVFVEAEERAPAAGAAQEAFALIDRLETLLSRHRPDSDLARVNAASAGQAVTVAPETFDCLLLAQRTWAASGGLFDVSIGALYRVWRDAEDRPRDPSAAEIQSALARTGLDKLSLEADGLRVRKSIDGLALDLGGIGKGYALDLAAALLRKDFGLFRTLWHSGRSTILAGDPPEGQAGWPVGQGGRTVALTRRALSSSGTAVRGAHVLHPHTGRPASGQARVWAYADTGAVSDAASTAAMLLDRDGRARFQAAFPDVQFVVEGE